MLLLFYYIAYTLSENIKYAETDFKILSQQSNIGFYQSCEVTQILLLKKGQEVCNFYTLVSFEEKPFSSRDQRYLTSQPININKTFSLGVQQYWLSIEEASTIFNSLLKTGKWEIDGKEIYKLGKFRSIPKQVIPAIEGKRLNSVLKNNFLNGSYILEFFDESKTDFSLLLDLKKTKELNSLSEKLKEIVPLDLAIARDRIGNIIFQFPITILTTNSKPLPSREGAEVIFNWHAKLQEIPDCIIETEAILDKNYMGAVTQDYSKEKTEKITMGNIDQINSMRVWRKKPNLILSLSEGTYIKNFIFNAGTVSHEPRIFQLGEKTQEVKVTRYQLTGNTNDVDYVTYINATIYQEEKVNLEKTLAFKQYFGGSADEALKDIRILIERNGMNGVYLWDPFLRSKDVLQTLFFSSVDGIPLKAIGSINKSIKYVLEEEGLQPKEVIAAQQQILNNPDNNNLGLNLEFRLQHTRYGWSFHDRFLIFPGSTITSPKVYSLGTSINSVGKSHHILQEVSHPQRVIDAFNDLWEQINHENCVVWKYPKK